MVRSPAASECQGIKNLFERHVGVGEHLVVGAILDGMWGEHTRHSGKAERCRLGHGSIDKLVGGDEHRRDATQFEIVDVVHTARRATASIRQGFDDHLAFGGDLVAKVDRCWLGEGRFHVAVDVCADAD